MNLEGTPINAPANVDFKITEQLLETKEQLLADLQIQRAITQKLLAGCRAAMARPDLLEGWQIEQIKNAIKFAERGGK